MANKTKPKLSILVLAIIATGLVIGTYLVQQTLSLRGRAVGEAVNLTLTPANASISGNTTLRLVANAKTNRISFLHADITFDRTKVNLSNEITTSSTLSRVVKKTSPAEANSTGRISIVLAVPPQNLGSAPTGVFEVASLPFSIVTTSTNQTTSVSFVQSAVQVVNTQTTALGSTLANSNLVINATSGSGTTTPPPAITTSGTVNLNPVADASVRSGEASTNFGTRTTMEINGSPVNLAYLKFDLSSLAGKTVTSAKLRFIASTDSISTQSIKEVSNTSWSETGLTYSNRPSLGVVLATSNGGTTGQLKEVDVTSFVKSRVGGLASFGIDQSGGDGYGIYSRESTDKPLLVVTYGTTFTPAPTSGGSTGSGVEVMFKNIPDPNTTNDVFVFNYATAGGTTYQETDSRLIYSGTWYSGTGIKYTVNTSTVKFSTSGTSATLVTSRGPNRSSRVEVYVNGNLKQVINLANSTVQDNYSVSINLQ